MVMATYRLERIVIMIPQEKLHQALSAMMKWIEIGPGVDEDGPSLADQLRSIDQIKEELGSDIPLMLQHYLEKRSYAKALDFLEGRDATVAPNC